MLVGTDEMKRKYIAEQDHMRKSWFDWAYVESVERGLIMSKLDIPSRNALMGVWFAGYARGKEYEHR